MRREDLLGTDPARLFGAHDRQRFSSALGAQRRDGTVLEPRRFECRLLRLDGSSFDAEVSLATISHQDRPAAEVIIRDITERKLAERQHHLASIVFETTDEAMMVTDFGNDIIAVNPAFERVTGYSASDAIGHNPRLLASGRHDRHFYEEMWDILARRAIGMAKCGTAGRPARSMSNA